MGCLPHPLFASKTSIDGDSVLLFPKRYRQDSPIEPQKNNVALASGLPPSLLDLLRKNFEVTEILQPEEPIKPWRKWL